MGLNKLMSSILAWLPLTGLLAEAYGFITERRSLWVKPRLRTQSVPLLF